MSKTKTEEKAPKTKKSKPTSANSTSNVAQLLSIIVDAMDDIKAENIVAIDLRQVTDSVTDFFVICDAEVNVQVRAVAENIVRRVRSEAHERPINKEGFENAEWILIDYANVVVHIFRKDKRQFYKLEDLWSDGQTLHNINDKNLAVVSA